jgi:hypothetical protein
MDLRRAEIELSCERRDVTIQSGRLVPQSGLPDRTLLGGTGFAHVHPDRRALQGERLATGHKNHSGGALDEGLRGWLVIAVLVLDQQRAVAEQRLSMPEPA